MYRGEIVAVLDGRTADKNEVGLLMATGGRSRRQPTTRDDRVTAASRRPTGPPGVAATRWAVVALPLVVDPARR